jgi:type II secretory pathway pseudopilin PulG
MRLPQHTQQAGLTFIEVIASIGVITFLLLAITPSIRRYEAHASVDDRAYRVALVIREAQVYGSSGKQYRAPGSTSSQRSGYGVRFVQGERKFDTFADLGPLDYNVSPVPGVPILIPNGGYEAANDDLIERIQLGRATIGEICVRTSPTGSWNCGGGSSPATITFIRPELKGVIRNGSGAVQTDMRIRLDFPGTNVLSRYITVSNIGVLRVHVNP